MELEPLRDEYKNSEPEHAVSDGTSSDSEDDGKTKRPSWGSRVEFLLAIVGYTVGVGSIWRFPMLCAKNGGGAFLIPFFFFMATCGGPLYYIEVCIGQFSGKSAGAAFEFCPLFKGLGLLMLIISFYFLWYYMIIMAYVQYYFICAFFPDIPWSSCDNWWNTESCTVTALMGNKTTEVVSSVYNATLGANETFVNITSTALNETERRFHILASPAQEFWMYNVLRKSSGLEEMGSVQIHLVISLFVAWLLIVLALIKGVQSLGKVVYFTATAPYILLTVLLIRGLTLNGSIDGVLWYIVPDFSQLLKPQVWLEAAVQVFYSLGPSWGGVISMSSHNRFHQKSIVETSICVFSDAFTAFYGGLVVFSIAGFMANEIGVSVAEIAKASGPGLAFVMFPEAITRMPLPHLWGLLFFFTLITTAFDTMFGAYETVVGTLLDKFPNTLGKRSTLTLVGMGLLMFVLAIPFCMNGGIYLFQLMDWYTTSIGLLFGSALESITICWIYGADRLSKDIELMMDRKTSRMLRFLWCFVMTGFLCTAFIIIMFTYSEPYGSGYTYQRYAISIGIALSVVPIIPIPVFAIKALWTAEGSLSQRLKTSTEPSAEWQPHDEKASIIYKEKPYTHPSSLCKRIKLTVLGDEETPWI